MENKTPNKRLSFSLNTVIYLLLTAMLACVIFVSIYTVAGRTKKNTEDTAVTTAVKTPETVIVPDTERVTLTPKPTSTLPEDVDSTAESVSAVPYEEDTEATVEPVVPTIHYFVQPVYGSVSKAYEVDIPVWSATMDDYRSHTGVDLSAPVNSEVIAASDGIVAKITDDPMMGRSVMLDHGDGIYTFYQNLSQTMPDDIAVGVRVPMGQVLGYVGETALIEIAEEPHLHFEMQVGGQFVNPLDFVAVSDYGDYEG